MNSYHIRERAKQTAPITRPVISKTGLCRLLKKKIRAPIKNITTPITVPIILPISRILSKSGIIQSTSYHILSSVGLTLHEPTLNKEKNSMNVLLIEQNPKTTS